MLKDYLSTRIEMGLDTIQYKRLVPVQQEPQAMYRDGYKFDLLPDCLCLVFYREVKLEPASLFSLKASYFVKHFWKKEYVNIQDAPFHKIPEEDIKKEIQEQLDYYSQNQYSRLSLLIGQITAAFGDPLISPPIININ